MLVNRVNSDSGCKSLKQSNSKKTVINQQQHFAQNIKQDNSNIQQINFGMLGKTTPVMQISFCGNSDKNPNQYMHLMAEMAPIAKTGGLAVVAEDLSKTFPPFNNSKHAFFIPYYNGENKNGKFVVREDEQGSYYTKSHSNKKIRLEKVESTRMEWGSGVLSGQKEDIALYRVKRKDMQEMHFPDAADIYMVYTPISASMEKEYANKNLGIVHSQFSKAVSILAPKLASEKNGNFNPQNIVCHDWHTSYFLNYANHEAHNGNKYYQNIKPGYIIHNLGRGYQGVSKNAEDIFNQVASNEEIKKVYKDPEFKKIKKMESEPAESHPGVDVQKKKNDYFKNILKPLLDEKGEANPSMIPLRLAEAGWVTMHAVSTNYAKELTEIPEFSEGLTNMVKKLKDGGQLIGIVNGLSSTSCDPTDKEKYPPNFKDFETYSPNDDTLSIRDVKRRNKANLLQRFVSDTPNGKLDEEKIIVNYNPNKDYIKGSFDKSVLNDPDAPLFIGWGRGDFQKGFDITLDAIEKYDKEHPDSKAMFIIGAGLGPKDDPERIKIEKKVEELSNGNLKGRFVFINGFAPANAMTSAADFALFTSRFEPCGLTQFEAMKYGCIPIVASTGGFASTVLQENETDKPTGYKTEHGFYMTDALLKEKLGETPTDENRRTLRDSALALEVSEAMDRATKENEEKHNSIMKNCITAKTGWDNNNQFNDGKSALERIQEHHFDRKAMQTSSLRSLLNRDA